MTESPEIGSCEYSQLAKEQRQYNGGVDGAGPGVYLRNESRNRPYTFHKNFSEINHRPKCKMQIYTITRRCQEKTLGLEISFFLDTIAKVWSMKENFDKQDFIKI